MKRLFPAVGMLLAACVATLGFAARAQAASFTWSNDGDALSMDPYMINETFSLGMASNVYDTLVTRGKKLEILPALATSWKRSDPNTWVFTLRKGVKFQGGESFTSEDVVFSYHRVLSAGSDLKGNFGSGGAASIVSMDAKGPYTVIIKTKEPNPILLSYLTILDILSKSWCEKNNAVDVT
ncbi:MAG TPA: ABC transporter substrate-binding protein, partial [bacterium]|nr:ABC transporter substrate-binding protein [bacterium]